jgi:hypothetical protein
MKIFIENASTLEFLTREGRWSKNKKEAAVYTSSAQAKTFGKSSPIGRFNVVGFFANSPQLTNLDDGCGSVATAAE